MKRGKNVRKKRLTSAERRKLKQSEVISERLVQLGKSEEWLVNELKRKFKIKKSIGREIIKGNYTIDLMNYVIHVSGLLKVSYKYFLED